MEQEWITDRLPTEADGDMDGDVRLRDRPGSSGWSFVRWSYVGPGAPWRHTSYWKPSAEPETTEPDRIGTLEQRLADRIAYLEERTAESIHALEQQLKEHIRAQSVLAAALVKRLEALEGLPPDRAIPEGGRGVPGGIAALEQRVAELGQLFWAHKHVAQPVSIPAEAQP